MNAILMIVAGTVLLIVGLLVGACLGAISHEAANHSAINKLHCRLAIAQQERDAAINGQNRVRRALVSATVSPIQAPGDQS